MQRSKRCAGLPTSKTRRMKTSKSKNTKSKTFFLREKDTCTNGGSFITMRGERRLRAGDEESGRSYRPRKPNCEHFSFQLLEITNIHVVIRGIMAELSIADFNIIPYNKAKQPLFLYQIRSMLEIKPQKK